MTSPSIPYQVSTKQQEAIVKYVTNCVESLSTIWNLREQFLLRDLFYYREADRSIEQSRALQANRSGDPYKYQNMQVPIVMPQVESALAYLAGVFFTGTPIFGVVADPTNADEALQMESVISDNSTQYGWLRQLIMYLRDGLKYNFGALEVTWDRKRIYSLINDPAANLRQGTKDELFYEGNKFRRLDPYNTIWDKRVHPANVHSEGEFVGDTRVMSRVQLKQLILDLNPELTMNARQAFESGTPTITLNGSDSWYYIPQINPMSFLGSGAANGLATTNWLAWAMIDGRGNAARDAIAYNNMYEVTTLYGKIIPQDFNLTVPRRNQPQIWKFILVNRKVLIYVERQTNAHNYLPVLVCQPNEDGLGYQSKSFLDNAVPFQSMSTSLWNAVIESKRRSVYDRIFYDPMRIRKEDIDRVSSVARIPVKQNAYGKPVSEAIHVSPYREDGAAGDLQMAENINNMADIANGQNKVQRGQFQKGNKTRQEFVETMGGANSRQQLQALGLEYQVFTPLKEIVKLNIFQYQAQSSIYNVGAKQLVSVKPQDLRQKAIIFKTSDGLLPSDKLMSSELLQVFMQTIQTSPLMQAEFDIIGAFAYWCKTQGAQWFEDFRRDPAARDQILSQLQAMNNPAPDAARPQNAQGPTNAQTGT